MLFGAALGKESTIQKKEKYHTQDPFSAGAFGNGRRKKKKQPLKKKGSNFKQSIWGGYWGTGRTR